MVPEEEKQFRRVEKWQFLKFSRDNNDLQLDKKKNKCYHHHIAMSKSLNTFGIDSSEIEQLF